MGYKKVVMIAVFILFFLLLYLLVRHFEKSRFRSLSITLVTAVLFIYLMTELCSVGALLTRNVLVVIYAVADLGLLILHLFWRKRRKIDIPRPDRTDILFMVCFCVLSVGTMVLALNVVPYNQDSMAYHLTRIVQWAQNHSIGHFASTVTRCVGSPVLCEVVDLQIYLLDGEQDRLLNLTQCVSYLINGLLVYGITRKLHGNRWMSALAAVLFYTMPIAFAESLTTQVDLFATVFLLIFVYIILDPIQDGYALRLDARGKWTLLILASSAALAYLAKPTVMIGMLAFTLWLFVLCIRRKQDWRLILTWIAATVGLALMIILPELIRNLVTYHAISDPWQGPGQLVHTADPRLLLIGFLKNLFFNLPAIYWPHAGHFFSLVVYKLGYIFHVNVDADVISEYGREYRLAQPQDYGCDTAVSPVITACMLLCVAVFVIHWVIRLFRRKKGEAMWHALGYSSVVALTYFLMCLIIRWEPYIGRYLLSYLALLCPMIAVQIQKIDLRYHQKTLYGMAIGVLVFVSAVEAAAMVESKAEMIGEMKAVDRQEAYYWNNQGDYHATYEHLVKELDQMDLSSSVGLYTGEGSYVYPLLRYLQSRQAEGKFIVGTGDNQKYEDLSYQPDAVVVMGVPVESNTMTIHDQEYTVKTKINDNCAILVKAQ